MTLQEALNRKLDAEELQYLLFQLAFLFRDERGVAEQVAWFGVKPESMPYILSVESTAEGHSGHLRRARELNRRAIESAEHAGKKGIAESWRMEGALREAAFGNLPEAWESALDFEPGDAGPGCRSNGSPGIRHRGRHRACGVADWWVGEKISSRYAGAIGGPADGSSGDRNSAKP
jgi:hypothetical protein